MQHFWHIMLHYFKKGKNATEMPKQICAVYGEGAVTDWMCQNWFAKFHAGDSSLDGAPQLGRPIEADSDQIETLIENNQHYTMWETADILKISIINKVIGENEKMCLLFYRKKTEQTSWPTQCYYYCF